MTERTQHLAVGITAIAGIVGLAILTLLFGRTSQWMDAGYEVSVVLPNANGLSVGARVHLDGIDVGRIEEVRINQEQGTGVVLQARIRESVRIPEDVRVTVKTQLIGGSSVLLLDTGALSSDQPIDMLPTDGTAMLKGEAASLGAEIARRLETSLEKAMREMRTALNDMSADLRQELAGPKEDFHNLAATWTDVGVNVRDLTEDRDPAAVDAGEAKPNLTTVLVRADTRLREMETVINEMNAWVGDAELRGDVKGAASSVNNLTTKVSDAVDGLSRRYTQVAEELSSAIRSAQQLLGLAKEEEGTVGKMLHDPKVYQNLEDATDRLNKLVDETRLLIEKWKKEGVPIQF